jgi:hypothetical protein
VARRWNNARAQQIWEKLVKEEGYFDKIWQNNQVELSNDSWDLQGNAEKPMR